MQDVYLRLAKHLENLTMGYPYNDALIDLLTEMFNPEEAEVALAIPNDLAPLEVASAEEIAQRSNLPVGVVTQALESLSNRNVLYSRVIESGEKGYALLQVGYGIPQTFFGAVKMMTRRVEWQS